MKKLAFLLVFPLLAGCEYLWLRPETDPTPTQVFEEAWQFADREYSFFAFKNIDWQDAYNRYRPLVNDDMTEVELFDVIADMLFELRDGHVNLVAPFDVSRNWAWYLNSPPNFNLDVLQRFYFKGEERYPRGFAVMDFGDVGYLRYGDFSSSFSSAIFDQILTDFQEKKGLIFDVRNNGGGFTSLADRLVGHIIDEPRDFGFVRYKNGPDHDDFSVPDPISIEPIGDTSYLKPIMLLTNRSSYSSTNTFTLMMSQLPHVTIVGDTTGGGGGYPAQTELSNGWRIRVSSSVSTTLDGFNVEDGIPPDIRVDLDSTLLFQGKDLILERALEELR